MNDLELSAELLGCCLVSILIGNKVKYALFDNETGLQCSGFYSLKEWAELNEAEVVLTYTGNN